MQHCTIHQAVHHRDLIVVMLGPVYRGGLGLVGWGLLDRRRLCDF